MLISGTCVVCRRSAPAVCAACVEGLVPVGAVAPPPPVERCTALFAYEGVGRDVVRALKFHHRRDVAARLAPALGATLAPGAALITWVPTTRARRWARGYDQSQLLARAVGNASGCPVVRSLVRRSGPQVGRNRADRLVGPSFTASRALSGHVVLVDDVVTTGASLAAAALVLRAAGATSVTASVLAHAPSRTPA